MRFPLLLFGVFACSTAVIFIKISRIDPVLLSGLRLAVAAGVLLPLFVRDFRQHRDRITGQHMRDAVVPGIFLALHMITWIVGARLTLAANASLIVNLVPIVMPLLLVLLVGEWPNRWENLATLIALVGMALLFAADYQVSAAYLRGDLICFCSMVLFAVYLALGRRYRHHPTLYLYMVPLYATSALVSFAAALFLSEQDPIDWSAELPWILALGIVPTVFGHTLLNLAVRHIRGQIVSIVNMLQFVFASLMAYPLLGEEPNTTFYVASAIVVAAGVMAALGREEAEPQSEKA